MNHLFKKKVFTSIFNQKVQTNQSNQELILNLSKLLCPLVLNVDSRNAGHSKWQNIRHTKSAKDSEKSKLYNRLAMGITRAALKGTDTKFNKELAGLLEVARKSNVSRDLIDRAIKRAQEQRLTTVPKGLIGPNNILGIVNFYFDPRFARPSTFLKPIYRVYKDFKFVDFSNTINFFDKKGFIFISKYDKNSQPINYEKIEEVAIEAETEEVEISCEEDKIIPPLEIPDEEEKSKNGKKSSKNEEQIIEEDSDELDPAMHWKLIVSEEGLLNSKGIIEKNYPDLIVKSHSIEYVPRDLVNLSEKEFEIYGKFCQDLSELEEFEKIYTNVNASEGN